jgi:hypothetical protein
MAMVTLSRKPVGKGQELDEEGKNKAIEYQGFAEDVLPDTADMLAAIGNDDDLFRVILRDAINEYLFKQVADPIAKYISPAWDEEMAKNFRAAVRSGSKFAGVDAAAKFILAQMK